MLRIGTGSLSIYLEMILLMTLRGRDYYPCFMDQPLDLDCLRICLSLRPWACQSGWKAGLWASGTGFCPLHSQTFDSGHNDG